MNTSKTAHIAGSVERQQQSRSQLSTDLQQEKEMSKILKHSDVYRTTDTVKKQVLVTYYYKSQTQFITFYFRTNLFSME